MAKKPKISFDEYYSRQEESRWNSIREALLAPNSHIEISQPLIKPYYLDEASVLAGSWIEAEDGNNILDLCAAPGGKTLVIAQNCIKNGFRSWDIKANERSQARRERLKKVIAESIPPQFQSNISIWGHDAGRWGQFESGLYDRILLDTPCSSERHVLNDVNELAKWSPERIKFLAQQSYVFLLSAIQALKTSGLVVYATCAITKEENDQVIERAIKRVNAQTKKLGYAVELALPSAKELIPSWTEKTEYGVRILPDSGGGRGPLFISRLRKQA